MLSWQGKSIPARVMWLLHCTGKNHFADMSFFLHFQDYNNFGISIRIINLCN